MRYFIHISTTGNIDPTTDPVPDRTDGFHTSVNGGADAVLVSRLARLG